MNIEESIVVKDLGPLKNVSIDIKPFTVFIGASGSGKSTLIKVIALFRWLYKMYNIRFYLKSSNITKSPFRFRMEKYLQDTGLKEFITEDTVISYTVAFESNNNKRLYTIRYENNELSKPMLISPSGPSLFGDEYYPRGSEIEMFDKEHLCFNKISFIPESRTIIPLWADRGATLSGAYLGFYFHEMFGDFDIANKYIKELNLAYLHVQWEMEESELEKKYWISNYNKQDQSNYKIEFKNSASGIQNTVPIILISEYFAKHFSFEDSFNRSVLTELLDNDSLINFKPISNLGNLHKKVFIHIEEPELSLYPTAQLALMEDLTHRCFRNNKNKVELIFSTHSPYIINHLNLLIKQHDTTKGQATEEGIEFEKLAVYNLEDGAINSLLIKDKRLVHTNDLSDPINDIYDRYEQLSNNHIDVP
ncbi:MAG: AAA family ATPase [Phycisphaerales bacterium]|nr:AAA family ATPase [Phycisphaerales bacterium]